MSEELSRDLEYFVNKHSVTRKQYAIEALRYYNFLQRQIEEFKKKNPSIRFDVQVQIIPIGEDSDEELQKAAVLVY